MYEKKIQLLKAGLERDFEFDTAHLPDEVIDNFVDQIEVHKDYFIWKLNISPDDVILEVKGRVNKHTVSQTDACVLTDDTGHESFYSDIEPQHRQQSPRRLLNN